MKNTRRLVPYIALTGLLLAGIARGGLREDTFNAAVDHGESLWRRVQRLDSGVTSRGIFTYALALCETGRDLDRLDRLFEVAARMQDRDHESRGYGNFRWKWEDGTVLDYNAVDFCMQHGSLIWLLHRDRLTPPRQKALKELIEYSIEGCLRHRVPVSYTNIALMNAQNLILLGQMMNRADVLAEGKSRLDEFCLYTAENGIHEYCSPTYYGVDIESLLFLHQFASDAEVTRETEALLQLFWEDLAANWYAPAGKLAGAHSRDYDYLHGLGILDQYLGAYGWIKTVGDAGTTVPYAVAMSTWRPGDDLRKRNLDLVPRLVQQSFGVSPMQSRTQWVLPHITLSTAGAGYGAMDLPMTVDFAGDRKSVRGYFIPDARRDPYGKKRIPAGGGHDKTLHLKPFWAACQRRGDALGLVMYRAGDAPLQSPSLESHIVLPVDVDAMWLNGERVDPAADKVRALPLKPGAVLAVRKGKSVLGIRVPWARDCEGNPARIALVFDGNKYGACRLTVAHQSFWGIEAAESRPGAAFWMRIADGIAGDKEALAWAAAFGKAAMDAEVTDAGVKVSVQGADGPLAICVAPPYMGCLEAQPAPSRHVLAVNGRDVGRELLSDLPAVVKVHKQLASLAPIAVDPKKGASWEAEAGAVRRNMVIGTDDGAFGSKYVWAPGKPGEHGGGNGTVTWFLNIPEPGTYYLWGRVLAPTPDDDSFFVSIHTNSGEPVQSAAWHTGTHQTWEWTPVGLESNPGPTPLTLPRGPVKLELRVREDGTAIDRLMLTPDPNTAPAG